MFAKDAIVGAEGGGEVLVDVEFADDRAGYLRLVTESIIPAAGPAGARFCDVFCEAGAFDGAAVLVP